MLFCGGINVVVEDMICADFVPQRLERAAEGGISEEVEVYHDPDFWR